LLIVVANPYASPETIEKPLPRRRTRWRILFVAPIVIFGVVELVSGIAAAILTLIESPEIVSEIDAVTVAAMLAFTIGSICWIAGGVLFWRSRWVLAVIALLVAIAATCAANSLMEQISK
jgi:hypothetical protein